MKRILFLSIFVIFVFYSNAQVEDKSGKKSELATYKKTKIPNKRHFVNFRFGWSFPVATDQIGSPRSEVGKTYFDKVLDASGNVVSYTNKNSFGSRGTGMNVSLGYGFMISENFSVEMDINYLYTLPFTDAYQNIKKSDGSIAYFAEQVSQTNMLRLSPIVGVYANELLKFRPYAKLGLIVPVWGKNVAKVKLEDNTGQLFEQLMPIIDNSTYVATKLLLASSGFPNLPVPTKADIVAVTDGSFSVGFLGKLGVQYRINDYLDVFGEVEMQTLTVLTSKTTFKEFYTTVNNDGLRAIAEGAGIKTSYNQDEIPEIVRVTEYVKEMNETRNSTHHSAYDINKANQELNFRENYTAFGIMLGVKYKFK